jgi:molybdopterin synthase catalytic subunit
VSAEPVLDVRVTPRALDAAAIAGVVSNPGAGAAVTFAGVVRNHFEGRPVLAVEYEAYVPMAERTLRQIADEAARRHGATAAAVHHRIGRLEVGEASVFIAVSAPHRAEAFAACREIIDRLKEVVPIWKKEHFEDGAIWIGSQTGERFAHERN